MHVAGATRVATALMALEFRRAPKGARHVRCPICGGTGRIVVDGKYERCLGCVGAGATYETSETTARRT